MPLFVVRVVTGLALLAAAGYTLAFPTEVQVEVVGRGFPESDVALWVGAGTLGLLGLLLVVGFLTRLVALLLLIVALIVVATVGREEGGLVLAATSGLSVALALMVWLGGGMLQIVNAVDPDPR